jgi:hypothetical protein
MIFSDMMVFVVLLLALKFQPDAFPSILVDYGWMVLLTEIELFILSYNIHVSQSILHKRQINVKQTSNKWRNFGLFRVISCLAKQQINNNL